MKCRTESWPTACQARSSRFGRPVPTLGLHPGYGRWAVVGSHWHRRRLELRHARREWTWESGQKSFGINRRVRGGDRVPCRLQERGGPGLHLLLTYPGSQRWSPDGVQVEVAASGVFQHLFGRVDLGLWRLENGVPSWVPPTRECRAECSKFGVFGRDRQALPFGQCGGEFAVAIRSLRPSLRSAKAKVIKRTVYVHSFEQGGTATGLSLGRAGLGVPGTRRRRGTRPGWISRPCGRR